MAVQQLTQPIVNPISAFDATRAHNITFTVIGGAQVVANRLVISNNETGAIVYNKTAITMKLEHTIPANTLTNGGYYNAVVYTIDNANNESVASTAVPFYCYSQPVLTIDNIPATETIENGTYTFTGTYIQQEGEILNSYQYTLYDSNKNVLSKTPLIYYETDSSLSYTFVGMSNDTSYYIELSGETVNGTHITSGVIYFTVRYIQPASFAICDLVNNCDDGYIQVSSNIVAIDGKSNPDPPIYIDDKEVDLRDSDSWVEWDSGFRIQDDFTLRAWGRDFNPYEPIITLKNDIDTPQTPNKIEMKWMTGDVIKNLPLYTSKSGNNINITDSEVSNIQNLTVGGNSIVNNGVFYSVGDIKNIINVQNFNITYNQAYYQDTNTNFKLQPNYLYTLSFDYNINSESTDLYFSIGYGVDSYETNIASSIQYKTQNKGRNTISFIVPEEVSENDTLWVRFAQTIILANVNVDISNIQLEYGKKVTDYQTPGLYNIYLTSAAKNLYNYETPLYLQKNNVSYTEIQGGYKITPVIVDTPASLNIGWKSLLNPGDTYTVSYSQLGQFEDFKLYKTDKNSQKIISEIPLNNNTFVAPDGFYDLQLAFSVDSSSTTNHIDIWNIQIEASNVITTYDPYISKSSIITLEEPLRSSGEYRDLICLASPNLLNPANQSASVSGGEKYYLSQSDLKEKWSSQTFPTFPNDISHGSSVSIGNDIFIFVDNDSHLGYVYKYNTLTDTYTRLRDVPYVYDSGSIVAVDNNIYIYGSAAGGVENYSKYAYKYDISTDTYTKIADIPYEFFGGSAVSTGTDIYLFGSYKNNYRNYAYKYDISTDTYTKIADIPYEFFAGSAVSVGTDIYLFGSGVENYSKYAYKYNTLTDTYTKITDIPYEFNQGSAVNINNSIYLISNRIQNLIINYSDKVSYTLDFINEDNNKISSIVLTSGVFTTPDNCVKVKIENVDATDLTNNKVQITIGETARVYYPYVTVPSLIRYCKEENGVISVLDTPIAYDLSTDNQSALEVLTTYTPISNVFTNNTILGQLYLDYVSGYSNQQTENAYVLLKCWNANKMPYVIHSNYIDIPSDYNKVFIWCRRKGNLFDLKIEDLGDYREHDKPIDTDKPVVELVVDKTGVTETEIPVTATSIDNVGLRTVRFSKDNGATWDEIVPVDGLSSVNSYTFTGLTPDTTYTIRAEAIDLSGNIGGISENATTLA